MQRLKTIFEAVLFEIRDRNFLTQKDVSDINGLLSDKLKDSENRFRAKYTLPPVEESSLGHPVTGFTSLKQGADLLDKVAMETTQKTIKAYPGMNIENEQEVTAVERSGD